MWLVATILDYTETDSFYYHSNFYWLALHLSKMALSTVDTLAIVFIES